MAGPTPDPGRRLARDASRGDDRASPGLARRPRPDGDPGHRALAGGSSTARPGDPDRPARLGRHGPGRRAGRPYGRPEAGTAITRQARPADGEVEITAVAGVETEPNSVDPRIGRFARPGSAPKTRASLGRSPTRRRLLGRVALVSLFIDLDGRRLDRSGDRPGLQGAGTGRASGSSARRAVAGVPVNLTPSPIFEVEDECDRPRRDGISARGGRVRPDGSGRFDAEVPRHRQPGRGPTRVLDVADLDGPDQSPDRGRCACLAAPPPGGGPVDRDPCFAESALFRRGTRRLLRAGGELPRAPIGQWPGRSDSRSPTSCCTSSVRATSTASRWPAFPDDSVTRDEGHEAESRVALPAPDRRPDRLRDRLGDLAETAGAKNKARRGRMRSTAGAEDGWSRGEDRGAQFASIG